MIGLPLFPGGKQVVAKFLIHAEVIQQALMGGPLQQGMMFMLAVDIHQHVTQIFQVGQGYRRSIDIAAGAPVVIHDPAQQALMRVRLQDQIVVGEPGLRGLDVTDREFGHDISTARAGPHDGFIGPVPERESQSAQNNRFSRACFAGNNGHAGLEFDFQRLDGGVILNTEMG